MTQDRKIYQTIYTDESDEKPKQIEWTIEELRDRVINSESINNYYKTNTRAWNFINTKNSQNLVSTDGKKEIWRKCSNYPYYGYETYASNRGRIKIKKDDEEIICELWEEISVTKEKYKAPLDKSLFNVLIKNQEKHIGWLKARIPGNKRCLRPHVYQMVADAWLIKDTKAPERTTVHHITNDGYDNRPENLILVSDDEHSQIHYGKKDDNYKPGKYDKHAK